MLINLDSNLAQYYADFQGFILEDTAPPSTNKPLLRELEALRQIVELVQLGEGWHVAAPKHLMQELLCKPTPERREIYSVLLQAWQEAGQNGLYKKPACIVHRIPPDIRVSRVDTPTFRKVSAERLELSTNGLKGQG